MVIAQMICSTFPAVKKQLAEYKGLLHRTPSPLTQQGLDSIRDKAFHCLGGSVYALLARREQRRDVLRFIVAFQTISDYLDNLCDRLNVRSEPAFRRLHEAMLDSLEPEGTAYRDYYGLYPHREDGGYLHRLVADCRAALGRLPGYPRSRSLACELTRRYIDLQSYKHLELKEGEHKLALMYENHRGKNPGLYWWEFAAACGSTLGVFTFIAGQGDPRPLFPAYMPWVTGLHIMLDYYIDQDEDALHGDMNLAAYHGGTSRQVERLLWFYKRAKAAVGTLKSSGFHALVIDGLLALYLSDAKARSPKLAKSSRDILKGANLRARVLESMARGLRIGRVF